MRKIVFAVLLCGVIFSSCHQRPDRILSEDTMTDIITDLQLNDAACQAKGISAVYDSRTYLHYYNQLFDKYNVEPEVFDSSLQWYTVNDIEGLRKIYKRVDKNIEKMREEFPDKE